jgi:hypothetical protein
MVNTTVKTPEEVIYSNNLFSLISNQMIRPRESMKNFEFNLVKTAIEDKIQRAKWIFEKSLESHQSENESDLRAQFNRLAANYVYNSCSEELLKDFGEDLCGFETAEERLTFLSGFYGAETKTEKIRRNKDKLSKLARGKNEKFELFLSKLTSIAEQISEKADAKEYICDQKFRESLSPDTESFLRDMCMLEKKPSEIANFLDKRERHISGPTVSKVDIDSKFGSFVQSTSDMIAKTSITFEEQIARLEDKQKKTEEVAEQRAQNLTNQISQLTATIAKLSFQQNQAPTRQNFQNRTAQNAPTVQNSFQPRPRFCKFCNVDTHYRSSCPYVTCFLCGERGHMRNRCPKNQNAVQSNSTASKPAEAQPQSSTLN